MFKKNFSQEHEKGLSVNNLEGQRRKSKTLHNSQFPLNEIYSYIYLAECTLNCGLFLWHVAARDGEKITCTNMWKEFKTQFSVLRLLTRKENMKPFLL